MSSNSKIEWTEVTWNPTTGCDRISPGCDNCYAMTLAKRLKGMGSAKYQTDGDPRTSGPGFGVTVHEDALTLPLRWRKPRRIFVNSMSDLFHDDIPDEFIARVWAVMAATPQHTYQILTKRHARMKALLSRASFRDNVLDIATDTVWPLPNVWLGVSVEDQKWADIRVPYLLNTPAAVRWLSMEPLLGPVNLRDCDGLDAIDYLDWIVVGGESGPGSRPMQLDWARSLRDQSAYGEAPFFFKQWGEWVAPSQMPDDTFMSWDVANGAGAYDHDQPWRMGKKRAGRLLDGRTWDEYPQAVAQ